MSEDDFVNVVCKAASRAYGGETTFRVARHSRSLRLERGITDVGAGLAELRDLESLEFFNTYLKTLPSLTHLTGLRSLAVRQCNLFASLPRLALPSLHELFVQNGRLKKIAANAFEQLPSLKRLHIGRHAAPLRTLPASLGDLHALEHLQIYETRVSSLPNVFDSLSRLTTLVCSECLLEELPRSIGLCTTLKQLYVTKNKLSALPDTFSNLRSLEVLHVGENPITQISPGLTRLTNLKHVSLGEHEASDGEIPALLASVASGDTSLLHKRKRPASSSAGSRKALAAPPAMQDPERMQAEMDREDDEDSSFSSAKAPDSDDDASEFKDE